MVSDDHRFFKGTIIDPNTVQDQKGRSIDVLDGGLPSSTTHIKISTELAPSGDVVIGAFVRGRTSPLTVRGKFKDEESPQRS